MGYLLLYLSHFRHPNTKLIIYTGDIEYSPTQILQRVKQRFNIVLPNKIDFIYLTQRKWIEASMYPWFTLLGQSLGSVWLGIEALLAYCPGMWFLIKNCNVRHIGTDSCLKQIIYLLKVSLWQNINIYSCLIQNNNGQYLVKPFTVKMMDNFRFVPRHNRLCFYISFIQIYWSVQSSLLHSLPYHNF